MILAPKMRLNLNQKAELFLLFYYVPALILLGVDFLAYYKGAFFPPLYWFLVLGNVLSLVVFSLRQNYALIGILLCSFFLLGAPSEYVGNSSTSLFVLYPLVYVIFRGQWLSVLLTILSYALSVYVGASDGDLGRLLGHVALLLFFAVPAGGFLRLSALRNEHARTELTMVQQRTIDHLSMALHDTALTSLTRELLRIRELASRTDDASVYTELMSIEEGLRVTSQSLRELFSATESQNVSPESLEILHADIELLARASSHPLQVENEVSDLEHLLTWDRYRFLLLVLREGMLNATKYAPRHTEIALSISQSAQGLEASVVSLMPEKVSADQSLSSGIGLENLRKRAEALGVDFFSGPVNGQWLHTLSIPYMGCEAVDAVEEGKGTESESGDGK